VAAGRAAFGRRPVEAARGVEQEIRARIVAVGAALEAVQDPLRPHAAALRELIDGAIAVRAVVVGRAVEIPLPVARETAVREARVGRALEGIERLLLVVPVRHEPQLVHDTRAMRATDRSDAEDVLARAVDEQRPSEPVPPVVPPVKCVDHLEVVSARAVRMQLVDDADRCVPPFGVVP
jgi:hypothetical protein